MSNRATRNPGRAVLRAASAFFLGATYYFIAREPVPAVSLAIVAIAFRFEFACFAASALILGAIARTGMAPSAVAEGVGAFWLASGCVFAYRDRVFVLLDVRWARFVRIAAWLLAILLLIGVLVRGASVLPHAAIGLAYLLLGRRADAMLEREPHRVRRVAVATVSVLIAIGAGLIILELGARLFITRPLPSPHQGGIWAHHPRAYWAPSPGADEDGLYRDSPTTFKQFAVRVSPQGMRGPEIGPKQAGELRVLLVGDSYSFGWAMPEGEDLASILRARLKERAGVRPVSVLNTSAIGYGPWQELILMEERGLPLKPDVVILQLFPANDGWNSLAKFNQVLPCYGPRMEEFVAYWRDHEHWVVRGETWLRVHSRAYHAYRTSLRERSVGYTELLSRLRFLTPYDPPPMPPHVDRPPMIEQTLDQWYPELQAGWDEMERDVLRIVKRCDEANVPIIVYALPYPTIAKEKWDAYMKVVAQQTGGSVDYVQFKDVRAAEAFLRKNNIENIPVLDPILKLPDPDSIFVPNDGHFNEKGGEFMAGLIVDRLDRDGFFKP